MFKLWGRRTQSDSDSDETPPNEAPPGLLESCEEVIRAGTADEVTLFIQSNIQHLRQFPESVDRLLGVLETQREPGEGIWAAHVLQARLHDVGKFGLLTESQQGRLMALSLKANLENQPARLRRKNQSEDQLRKII